MKKRYITDQRLLTYDATIPKNSAIRFNLLFVDPITEGFAFRCIDCGKFTEGYNSSISISTEIFLAEMHKEPLPCSNCGTLHTIFNSMVYIAAELEALNTYADVLGSVQPFSNNTVVNDLETTSSTQTN